MGGIDVLENRKDSILKLNSKLFHCICAEIEGVPTEFVWVEFANCIFLAVTQYGKVGSLVSAEREEYVSPLEGNISSYDVKVLLGRTDIETQLAGRYLAQNLHLHKSLYLFCNLKDYGVEVLKAIKDVFADVLNL